MTKRTAVRWTAKIGVVISLALLGACGGGSDTTNNESESSGSSEQQSSTTESETPDSSASDSSAAATVEIVEFAYAPKEITVKVGDTVEWVNRDAFLHTVTSGAVDGPENKPDDKFDEDLDEAGSKASVTFDEAGTFTYYCKQHNAMDGVVIVE